MPLDISTIHLKALIENPVVFLINFPMNMPAITGVFAFFGIHFLQEILMLVFGHGLLHQMAQ